MLSPIPKLPLIQLKKFRENDAIKAIVMRINSPGGAVGPSQEILEEINKNPAQEEGGGFHGDRSSLRGILYCFRG